MKKKLNAHEIITIIKSVVPEKKDCIPLHEPKFDGNEWEYVKDCLDVGWVSSVGKYVDLFEEKLAEYTGVKKAIAVVNGTAALHICLQLVGVEQNDEVLVPALSFVATANAVTYCGAIPHFIDSEEKTLGLDPYKLKDYLDEIAEIRQKGCINKITGRRIKAVVPMHTFGHPVDLDPLVDLCSKYKLELIEDAAESLGSYYKGKHTGNLGKASALSFNGNKIITTGGGGAIITNDEKLGKLAKHITTTAKIPHRWAYYHDTMGYNYRLPNINAALGCAQLEKLPYYIKMKRMLAGKYCEIFQNLEGVTIFKEPEFALSNYWLNVLLLNNEEVAVRDEILNYGNNNGIMLRPVWNLLSKLPMYQNFPKMDISTASSLEKRIINLPSSVSLGGDYV